MPFISYTSYTRYEVAFMRKFQALIKSLVLNQPCTRKNFAFYY